MVSFRIIPNFFQNSYEPGKSGKVGISIINTGRLPFYLRKIGVQFDWQDEKQAYRINRPVQPRRRYGLGVISFRVPKNITGLRNIAPI